jgi:RNA polymerase sigma factor (sigma-70 family)
MARATLAARGAVPLEWNDDSDVVRTDAHLLQQFLCQNDERAEAAFATLVERYGPIVHRVCFDVLGSWDEAQDAAQAVFLVLARKARSIRKPGSLGPWLHGVALRVARRARSEAAKRRAAERRKAEITHERDTAKSGLERMEHAELHEEIHRLPEKYRQPIILCYMQGQTQEEAAQALGWPLGTVQIRLHRGRERLRTRLSRRTGLIALTAHDLKSPPPKSPGVLGREWTLATARAAVPFAAGKGTLGLVAPTVTGVAESEIAAMLGDSLRIVALLASPFLAGALYLALTGVAPKAIDRGGSGRQPTPISATLIKPEPALQATTPQLASDMAREKDQAAVVAVKNNDKPPPVTQAETTATPTSTVVPAPPDRPVTNVEVTRPIRPAPRSGSLAMVGTFVQKTPNEGRELFERVWVANDRRSHGGDGLGPVFNGQSCVGCHHLGGTGGAGGIDRNIDIGTVSGPRGDGMGYTGYSYSFSMDFGTGRMEYRIGGDSNGSSRREAPADLPLLAAIHPGFRETNSIVLHRYGTDPAYNAWRSSLLGRHRSIVVESSERNTPALFGAGLIDAIPDAAIEAAARRKSSVAPQVKGRISRLKDGRVGRFGWKAQTATLHEFVRSAAAGEMGLEVPGRHQAADPRLPGVAATGLDMDESECNALVEFVRNLPAPMASSGADDKDAAQIKSGEATFRSVGCTACHVPKLGDVEGIYSDLLLHDMGPQLADVDAYTVFVAEPSRRGGAAAADRTGGTVTASVREWRTSPLWGVRDSSPYLHDGRAATLAQAITLHAGQAATSARRFAELSPRRKQQVEAFLLSLAAPPGDR